jgi:hypothetical protein
MSSSTEYTYARLEAIVHEQEAARARLRALERDDAALRSEVIATLTSLAHEYEQLYVVLDAYAEVESHLDPLGAALSSCAW